MDRQWLLIGALSLAVVLILAGGVVRSWPATRLKGKGWALTCLGLGIPMALLGTAVLLPYTHGASHAGEVSARTVFAGIGCAGLGLMLGGLYLAFKRP